MANQKRTKSMGVAGIAILSLVALFFAYLAVIGFQSGEVSGVGLSCLIAVICAAFALQGARGAKLGKFTNYRRL